MHHAVLELGELGGVPPFGRAHQIARDALQRVYMVAVAHRALGETLGGVFIAAVHAAVPVVVHASIADVVAVHKVHYVHDGLRVVRGIAVNLHIEDVSALFIFMIRGLDFGLMARRAVEIDRNVAGVGVVFLVRDSRDDSERLLVHPRKPSGKALCGRGQYAVVVVIGLGEAVGLVAHERHYPQTELLGLIRLSVMLAHKGYQTFGQSDESDSERALIDDALHGVVGRQLLASDPELAHQQGELLDKGRLLEIEAVVQLASGEIQQLVQLLEEHLYALFLVRLVHALDRKADYVYGGEAEVAPSYRGLGSEAVLIHPGAASHGRDLMLVALGVVGAPCVVLVEGGVKVQEVREETAGADLAGELVEVIVGVLGKVAHSALLLPYLDGEDGGGSVSDALIGRVEYFPDYAAALGRSVRAVVYGAEHHLVASAGVDGVHVVDKRLHGLMHPAHCLVHGMGLDPLAVLETVQFHLYIIVYGSVLEAAVIDALESGGLVDLLLIGFSHEGSQIEVKRRNGLTAVHLVLHGLHGYAGEHRRGLYPLGGTGLAVTGLKAFVEDLVQRMLEAGEALGGIVVLVMDMDIAAIDRVPHVLGQEAFVHIGLGGLGGELHHHACGSVGVHVGVLAGDVVGLGGDYLLENLVALGLAGHVALVAVGDVFAGDLLAGALHELEFHTVLNLLHRHAVFALLADHVGNPGGENYVFAGLCDIHGLEDCGHYLLVIEIHHAPVALDHMLYHSPMSFPLKSRPETSRTASKANI